MSSDVAIRVDGLGKSYSIRHQVSDHVTLAQVALERARHPFRRNEREDFWALRDVSFEVPQGEVLGVIGRNGAGKSTLLKLLTRITAPSTGRIDVWGRIGSLLEVGTGFHPELTGRENIYLNGSILGMSRKEIDRQFDAIVDFASVERFLDTPVKRYSSGMYVRLAFAVAAHLETEILLVDEVLAVGDQEFQRRCLGKMHDVAEDGRTVLFVSHQLDSIRRLCSTALLLSGGRAVFHGATENALAAYLDAIRTSDPLTTTRDVDDRPALGITHVSASSPSFGPAESKLIHFTVTPEGGPDDARLYVAAVVRNDQGDPVAHCDSRLVGFWIPRGETSSGSLRLDSPWLRGGRYTVDFYLCEPTAVLQAVEPACEFDVHESLPYPATAGSDAYRLGHVLANFQYEKLGRGLALPEDREWKSDARHPA